MSATTVSRRDGKGILQRCFTVKRPLLDQLLRGV
jgi:hypothetical protein